MLTTYFQIIQLQVITPVNPLATRNLTRHTINKATLIIPNRTKLLEDTRLTTSNNNKGITRTMATTRAITDMVNSSNKEEEEEEEGMLHWAPEVLDHIRILIVTISNSNRIIPTVEMEIPAEMEAETVNRTANNSTLDRYLQELKHPADLVRNHLSRLFLTIRIPTLPFRRTALEVVEIVMRMVVMLLADMPLVPVRVVMERTTNNHEVQHHPVVLEQQDKDM